MLYYKFLTETGIGPYSGFSWPLPTEDGPGEWVKVPGRLKECSNGIHAVSKVEFLPTWIHEGLYTVEYRKSPREVKSGSVLGREARLLEHYPLWDKDTRRCWIMDCFEKQLRDLGHESVSFLDAYRERSSGIREVCHIIAAEATRFAGTTGRSWHRLYRAAYTLALRETSVEAQHRAAASLAEFPRGMNDLENELLWQGRRILHYAGAD